MKSRPAGPLRPAGDNSHAKPCRVDGQRGLLITRILVLGVETGPMIMSDVRDPRLVTVRRAGTLEDATTAGWRSGRPTARSTSRWILAVLAWTNWNIWVRRCANASGVAYPI